MSLSPSRIRIHAIYSKKDRLPLIHPTDDQLTYKFPEGEFREMTCPVKIINAMDDHVHLLFLLYPHKLLDKVIQQTIGGSSHPVYPQNLMGKKSCQTRPPLFTTGGNLVDKASPYTETRKEGFSKKSFQTKYNEIIKNHGFETEI